MSSGRAVILFALIGSFLLPLNAAFCQNTPGSEVVESPPSAEQVEFPAVREFDFSAPLRERFAQGGFGSRAESATINSRAALDPALSDMAFELMHRRPLLVWRAFAELPLPPLKTFLVLLFADLLICLAFRHRTYIASMRSRSKFWKSLGVGIIVVILCTTCSRLCSETFILRPLASVLLGVLQFFCLAGIAVSSRALGSALLGKLKILKPETVSARPILILVASVFVGTLIISFLAILPVLGSLPRLGARLLILFSMLGLGAICSTELGTKGESLQ